jgi:hypothetical protein
MSPCRNPAAWQPQAAFFNLKLALQCRKKPRAVTPTAGAFTLPQLFLVRNANLYKKVRHQVQIILYTI